MHLVLGKGTQYKTRAVWGYKNKTLILILYCFWQQMRFFSYLYCVILESI